MIIVNYKLILNCGVGLFLVVFVLNWIAINVEEYHRGDLSIIPYQQNEKYKIIEENKISFQSRKINDIYLDKFYLTDIDNENIEDCPPTDYPQNKKLVLLYQKKFLHLVPTKRFIVICKTIPIR
jgi:hypothetical protein